MQNQGCQRKLTWEPLSNQSPNHQVLKAELPIIRKKRHSTRKEIRYPARGAKGCRCEARGRFPYPEPHPWDLGKPRLKRKDPYLEHPCARLTQDVLMLGPCTPIRISVPFGWK